MDTTSSKAAVFQQKLDTLVAGLADKVLPALIKLAPAAEKAASGVSALADLFAKNPFVGLGAVIGGYILKELAVAGIGKLITNALSGGGGAAAPGGMGGALGAIGLGAVLGGAIGSLTAESANTSLDAKQAGANSAQGAGLNALGAMKRGTVADKEYAASVLDRLESDRSGQDGVLGKFVSGATAGYRGIASGDISAGNIASAIPLAALGRGAYEATIGTQQQNQSNANIDPIIAELRAGLDKPTQLAQGATVAVTGMESLIAAIAASGRSSAADPITGTLPMPPSDLDIARNLLTPSFRNVAFYCGPWSFSFEQGQSAHLFPDRDAGLIEGTGRDPATYKFTAYFRNGIAGSTVPQYPVNWRAFVAACTDKSTGTLVHPELGPISVKCKSMDTSFDMMRRDGVDVDVVFIESPAAEDELTDLLKQASPTAQALSAARDLDNAIGNISPIPVYPDAVAPSLLESMKRLTGALAMFRMGVGNIGSGVDGMLGALGELRDSIAATGDPKAYKALDALTRAFDAVVFIALNAKLKGKPITAVSVRAQAPATAIATLFNTPIDDFLRMNPGAADRATVRAGSLVFVYA